MNNSEYQNLISNLKTYSEIADILGEYKLADECHILLKQAENFNNPNVKTAMDKVAFLRKLKKFVSKVGKGIGGLLKNPLIIGLAATFLTGGAGAAFMAKLGPMAKNLAPKALKFLQSGGKIESLLQSVDPNVREFATKFLQEAKTTQTQQAPQGMQAGMSQTLQNQTATMGYQPPVNETNAQAIQTIFNEAVNALPRSTPQTINNVINTFNTRVQQILNQEIQRIKTSYPGQAIPTEQSLMIPQYRSMLIDRAKKANLIRG